MEKIIVNAKKYGDILHYSWETNLLEKTDDFIIVKGEPGRVLHHYTKGKQYTMDNWSLEFFPFNKWFTVSIDIKDGKVEGYYCNISQPSTLEGKKLSFIDLDLDIVKSNGNWEVVDEEDFQENQIKYNYPQNLVEETRLKLESLKSHIEKGMFPFDGYLVSYVDKIIEESRQVSNK